MADYKKYGKTRVLIVDDSAVVREVLRHVLDDEPDIEVVGLAADAQIAREKIKALDPDVLTLDVEMAGMNGLEFLERVMRLRPMPVIMISSHTHPGDEMAIRALEMGAVDVVGKNSSKDGVLGLKSEIVAKVRAAARARLVVTRDRNAPTALARYPKSCQAPAGRIVAIGASTGGVQALNTLLGQLPEASPPILVVQHMPAGFTRSFARRLDRNSRISVSEAEDGMPIVAGHAYVAPGDRHLVVARAAAGLQCRLMDGPPVNQHMPSIDVLFSSVAENAGYRGLGIIMTGMGSDGVKGLELMRRAGAPTACQDESSSLIYGMPRAAVESGAAQRVLSLDRLASFILETPMERRPVQAILAATARP